MTIAATLLLALFLLVNTTLLAELAAGLRAASADRFDPPARPVAIVIPAHDEAQGIAATIEALKSEAPSNFRILVVADNCTDDTFEIARRFGVEVAERHDASLRGKGYALDFARDMLRKDPPAAVIVLDADCRIDRESLVNLAGASLQLEKPAQAVNLLNPAVASGAMVQISSFAFLIKNLVRQRGLQRLAGGVHLTGTGMCLPWSIFDCAALATPSIVEDVQLGIELAAAGGRPQLVEGSRVWSAHAEATETIRQRRRWEGGFLALAIAATPRIIGRGLTRGDPRMIFSGLDLMVPPLALLALVDAALLLLFWFFAIAGWSSWTPAAMAGLTAALVGLGLALAWWREGRQFVTPGTLLKLPLYALWKVPMYLGLVRTGAPSNWQRTRRTAEKDREA